MLKKGDDVRFGTFSERAEAAFWCLKVELSSSSVLAVPKHGRLVVLDEDACDGQIGCVLMPPDDEKCLLPVGYWSRTLCNAERSYDTTERECRAIVWAIF